MEICFFFDGNSFYQKKICLFRISYENNSSSICGQIFHFRTFFDIAFCLFVFFFTNKKKIPKIIHEFIISTSQKKHLRIYMSSSSLLC